MNATNHENVQAKPLQIEIMERAKPGCLEKDSLSSAEKHLAYNAIEEGVRSILAEYPGDQDLAEFTVSPSKRKDLMGAVQHSIGGGSLKRKAASEMAKSYLNGWIQFIRCAPVLKKAQEYAAELQAEISAH